MANAQVYPSPKFYFRVKIGNTQLSFQEVTGLEQQVELLEYRHGKSPLLMTQKRAGLTKASTLTLKRGVFSDRDELVTLFGDIMTDKAFYPESGSKLELEISLLDDGAGSAASPIVTWTVANA
ncbi:MAG: phage tail protein, partial [Bacteroidetes bacterium]